MASIMWFCDFTINGDINKQHRQTPMYVLFKLEFCHDDIMFIMP